MPLDICGSVYPLMESYLEWSSHARLRFTPKNEDQVSFTIDDTGMIMLHFDLSWFNTQDDVEIFILPGCLRYTAPPTAAHATALMYHVHSGNVLYLDPTHTSGFQAQCVRHLLKIFKTNGIPVNKVSFYPEKGDYGVQYYQELEHLMRPDDPPGYCVSWVMYLIHVIYFGQDHVHHHLKRKRKTTLTEHIRHYTTTFV